MRETFQEYTARMLALVGDDDVIAVLSATPARLGRLMAGRTAGALQQRPAVDRWSVAQILSHLLDAEVVLAYRMRRILASPGTAIEAYDQDSWVAAAHADVSDGFESLSVFAALRVANLRRVGGLSEEERQHVGVHVERGPETIAHLLKMYAGHDRNHLAQIEGILADLEPGTAQAFAAAPVKPEIDGTVLERLDVRAGTIRAAVPVEGTDRLALLTVSFADRERTIVAGIRTERPSLDAIVGRQCLFVVNLPAATIRGQVSEGMLFDIGFADGLRPAFATPEWPVPDGTRAG